MNIKLSTKIFLSINGFMIAILILLLSILIYNFSQNKKTDIEQQLLDVVAEKNKRFEEKINSLVQVSHSIADDVDIKDFFLQLKKTGVIDEVRKSQLSTDLATEYANHPNIFENLFFVFNEIVIIDGLGGKSEGYDFSKINFPWYNRLKANLEPTIGRIQQSPISGLPVMVSAYPIKDEKGSSLAFFGLALNMNGFSLEIIKSEGNSPMETMIIQQSGEVIAAKNIHRIFNFSFAKAEEKNIVTFYQQMLNSPWGVSQFTLDGVNMLAAWHQSKKYGTYTISFMPLSIYTAFIERYIRMSLLLLLFFSLFSSLLSLFISRQITKPIHQVVDWVYKMSQGDLTQKIEAKREDEIGVLIDSLANLNIELNAIVDQIKQSSQSIASGSSQISSASQVLSSVASNQASSVEQISSSIEEITGVVIQNTDSAIETERAVTQVFSDIKELEQSLKVSITEMMQVSEKIAIIGEIASRTDMLALNASIEAARSGRSEKGFAVVASEIKKLANKSKSAAITIKSSAQSALEIASGSENLLNNIVQAMHVSAELMKELKSSGMDQKASAEQINSSTHNLSDLSFNNSASAEELATSAEEFSAQAQQLLEVISFFKTAEESLNKQSFSYTENTTSRKTIKPSTMSMAKNAGTPSQNQILA